jgi:DinB superfamily
MRVPDPGGGFVVRTDEAMERLAGLAESPPPRTLTDPDPGTGERWDWGQVWAHLAEFPAFWMGQVQRILDEEGPDPVPFGRVKSDEGRIAAIEADRRTPVGDLYRRVEHDANHLKAMVADLSPEQWARTGRHSTLGVMDVSRIVEEFLVGHLEQHAAQLEGLLGSPSTA